MRLSHRDNSLRQTVSGRPFAVAGLAVAASLAMFAPAMAQQQGVVGQSIGTTASVEAANDPLEGFNRGAFKLGMGLDHVVLAPIAHGYMAVTPRVVRDRVSAAVYNLGEPNTAMNMVLQGKPKQAMRSTTRFVVNSTVGVLGLFDVASKMNLPRRDSDFGQTLGKWGAKPGAYLYVPLMGPLNVRDGVGRALDIVTDPVSLYVGGLSTDFGKARTGATIIDLRAKADPAYQALKDAADPYVTTRSAYTQYREAFVREATGAAEVLPDFDTPPPDAPPQGAPSPAPKP